MMQGKTPKAQADAGMGELKRQIIYKGQWHHGDVQLAHRFYPSSKTLLQLPDRERETQAGTGLAMQQLYTTAPVTTFPADDGRLWPVVHETSE